MDLYSYVVAYDSGFAPNPFYGFCTLATCKPRIRNTAQIGDWVIGSGSADKSKKQGGLLVYAMKISEILTFDEYFNDVRFQQKKPLLTGSRKQARGDNIYHQVNDKWDQLNSYHSNANGVANIDHVTRDTRINRVLIAEHYCYFGKNGPTLPDVYGRDARNICHHGRNHSKFSEINSLDKSLINDFVEWFNGIGELGFMSPPFDWRDTQ